MGSVVVLGNHNLILPTIQTIYTKPQNMPDTFFEILKSYLTIENEEYK